MSIIRDRAINTPIHCVYFYYVKYPKSKQQQDGPEIRSYYYFEEANRIRDDIDLRRILKMLARNAIIDDHAPPPSGRSFSEMLWRRRSYLAILVDGPDQTLSDLSEIAIDYVPRREEFNHSFFNARLIDVDLSEDNSDAMVTIYLATNLMRHESERRDMHDGESEPYDIVVHPGSAMELRIEDDGGTNQGGPIPPFIEAGVRDQRRS